MKISFAQKLRQASLNPSPVSKPTQYATPEKKCKQRYEHFNKHHSEIKNMLKQLEGNPEGRKIEMGKKGRIKKFELKENIRVKKETRCENEGKILKSINNIQKLSEEEFDSNIFMKSLRKKKGVNSSSIKRTLFKKGLPNNGNSCYINSVLQCLFHLPQFNSLLKKRFSSDKSLSPSTATYQYTDLYSKVMRDQGGNISTLPLKKIISKICSLFIDFQQQDAHQFLQKLLGSMHEELNEGEKNHLWKPLEVKKNVKLSHLAEEYWNYYKKIDNSYIYDSFCGQIYNRIQCSECHTESKSFENFLDLSLPLLKSYYSLEDLVRKYFDYEVLSDYYFCSFCRKEVKNSVKKSQIWKLPPYLIIHLKRSQFGKKNNDKIQIPIRSLDIRQFIHQSNDKSIKNGVYSLSSIVLHKGMIDGGHYWAQVKEEGNWITIDDEQIVEEKSGEENYLKGNQYAYILFYKSLFY